MNNCFGNKKLISRLIDGDLSSDESDGIKEHCFKCVKCSAVYNRYLNMQKLLNECYSDEPLHYNMAVKPAPIIQRFLSRFTIKTLFPSAALALTLIIMSLTLLENQLNNLQLSPFLIENSAAIMNTPLGSLTYYEELDGTTVQSQFTKLSTGSLDIFDKNETMQFFYPSYSSPLFYETDVDGINYFHSIGNCKSLISPPKSPAGGLRGRVFQRLLQLP